MTKIENIDAEEIGKGVATLLNEVLENGKRTGLELTMESDRTLGTPQKNDRPIANDKGESI